MNIVITGAAGFIGKHVAHRLRELGHNILEIDKKFGSDLNRHSVRDWMFDKMPQVDFIVNLAGTCSTPRGFIAPKEAFHSNTEATIHVMEFARRTGAKVIHTSSIKAQVSDDGMYTPYGLTKYMGEMIVREWGVGYNVPVIVNRPGTVYGPGQHGSEDSGWIAWFIAAALTDQQVTVNGNGKHRRDLLFVSDYVDAVVYQINNFEKCQEEGMDFFSIGGGDRNSVTILQAIEYINTLVPLKFVHGPVRKGDNKNLVSDNWLQFMDGATWAPKTNWMDGIKLTIEWYQKHKELL